MPKAFSVNKWVGRLTYFACMENFNLEKFIYRWQYPIHNGATKLGNGDWSLKACEIMRESHSRIKSWIPTSLVNW